MKGVESPIDQRMWQTFSIRSLELLVREMAILLIQTIPDHHCILSGLSLLGYRDLEDLDPVYCMPADVVKKRGLQKNWLALARQPS